jgi:hypothetical protein
VLLPHTLHQAFLSGVKMHDVLPKCRAHCLFSSPLPDSYPSPSHTQGLSGKPQALQPAFFFFLQQTEQWPACQGSIATAPNCLEVALFQSATRPVSAKLFVLQLKEGFILHAILSTHFSTSCLLTVQMLMPPNKAGLSKVLFHYFNMHWLWLAMHTL